MRHDLRKAGDRQTYSQAMQLVWSWELPGGMWLSGYMNGPGVTEMRIHEMTQDCVMEFT